jgi:hypothetical protein
MQNKDIEHFFIPHPIFFAYGMSRLYLLPMQNVYYINIDITKFSIFIFIALFAHYSGCFAISFTQLGKSSSGNGTTSAYGASMHQCHVFRCQQPEKVVILRKNLKN